MARLWIVDRSRQRRAALARLAAATEDAVLGAPGDLCFESGAAADVVLLALSGDWEQELEFAHAQGRHAPHARWILIGNAGDEAAALARFDTRDAQFLMYPPDPRELRSRIHVGTDVAPSLSERVRREAVASRFARWFGDLDLPDVLRALDPRLDDVPVWIRGERGTGRSVVARYIHYFGGTAGGILAHVPCSPDTRPADLIAAIDAWIGADHPGRLAIWLEDLDRLPPATQRVLLSWLETGPPGAAARARTLRWLATVTEPSAHEAPDPELQLALSGVVVELPTLRTRTDEIATVADSTARVWCAARRESPRRFGEDALAVMEEYPWPGNLRELEALVTQTLAAVSSDPVRSHELQLEGVPFSPLGASDIGALIDDERASSRGVDEELDDFLADVGPVGDGPSATPAAPGLSHDGAGRAGPERVELSPEAPAAPVVAEPDGHLPRGVAEPEAPLPTVVAQPERLEPSVVAEPELPEPSVVAEPELPEPTVVAELEAEEPVVYAEPDEAEPAALVELDDDVDEFEELDEDDADFGELDEDEEPVVFAEAPVAEPTVFAEPDPAAADALPEATIEPAPAYPDARIEDAVEHPLALHGLDPDLLADLEPLDPIGPFGDGREALAEDEDFESFEDLNLDELDEDDEPLATPPPRPPSLAELARTLDPARRDADAAAQILAALIPQRFDEEADRQRLARALREAGPRLDPLARQLASVSSPAGPAREKVNVAELLEELLESRRERIRERRLLVLKELDTSQPHALGDAALLRLTLETVLGAALDWVPPHGDVYLASRHHGGSPGEAPSVRVLIRFHNPRPGIDSVAVRMTDASPALSVAEALVRAQGGSVGVAATDGEETVVLIDLPAP